MNNKRAQFFVLILCLLMFSGCSALLPEPTATPTQTPIPTSTSPPTSTPTITPSPTLTPTPTPTFTPTPIGPEDLIAMNYVESQTLNHVEVEIVRFLIADKDILLKGHPQVKADKIQPPRFEDPIFADKPVVGELIFRMTNQGNSIYTLFPADLTIQIGGGQLVLLDYILAEAYISKSADPFNPDILPGSTIYMAYWFGVEDYDIPEIDNLVVALEGPYKLLSDGTLFGYSYHYYYQIDLSEGIFEPMPEEVFEALY